MSEQSPQPELQHLPAHYEYHITDEENTGVRLFTLENKDNGISTSFAEFNSDVDIHNLIAWVGARTSRSPDQYADIYRQVHEAQNASEKLEQVFVNYGHASVADMSPVMLFMNHIPMEQAFWMFNHTSTGGGQELSTRYVELDDLGIRPVGELVEYKEDANPELVEHIEAGWEALQRNAAEKYQKWTPLLAESLKSFLEEEAGKAPKGTVTSRTLDVSRFWIPAGAETSMTLLNSTRNWVDMISQLRAHGRQQHVELADQLHDMLKLTQYRETSDIKANLSGLTKYSEGKDTVYSNLRELENTLGQDTRFTNLLRESEPRYEPTPNTVDYIEADEFDSPGEAVVMQYISTLYPHVAEREILGYLKELTDTERQNLGEVVFKDHMHHDMMRNLGDIRGPLMVLDTAMAYLRDLNRHRSSGRLTPALEGQNTDAIVYAGYNQNYQIENAEYLQQFKQEWDNDMKQHYTALYQLYEDLKEATAPGSESAILNLLPLGHQMKMHYSSPLTQYNYMASLRIALGGDYGYRDVVYQMLDRLRTSEPYLASMLPHVSRPDVNSAEEILGRS